MSNTRIINKFLKNKVNFQQIKNDMVDGRYRIVKVNENKSLYDIWSISVDVEFKGKLRLKTYGRTNNQDYRSLSDFRWTSVIRRNKIVRSRLNDEVRNFIKYFNLTSNPNYIKIGKVNWIK